MAETKELKAKEKQEFINTAEQTQSGLVFTPAVDIFETEREITLLADMPGVTGDNVTIDLNEGILTVSGNIKPWEEADESDVLIEFEVGKYYRQFSLSEVIDQSKIEAKMEDGVLRLVLPKAEKAMPRKITVTS
ncbi:Hsp20/alpha crystallin family protein [Desulfobacterium sp. N47]|uniref:Uncharacterized protein n=1 Tax=uncultured Desulfobacterium sp. TaxID=201089 RepID=E1Y913_9BACT|nr:hypothetical protein N47_A10860 [uncultured Desulfobacterium sp.]